MHTRALLPASSPGAHPHLQFQHKAASRAAHPCNVALPRQPQAAAVLSARRHADSHPPRLARQARP